MLFCFVDLHVSFVSILLCYEGRICVVKKPCQKHLLGFKCFALLAYTISPKPLRNTPSLISPYLGGEADSDTIAEYMRCKVYAFSASSSPRVGED
jgi:hypothetical protein